MSILSIIWTDFIEICRQASFQELAMPIGLLLWSSLLLIPYNNIDRRDVICGLTYSIFMVFAGILLILVLPREFTPMPGPAGQLLIMMVICLIASVRWFWQGDLNRARFDKLIQESEK